MKALVILMLPALMLIGCGQMDTNEDTAQNILSNLNANGSLSNDDLANVDENLLDQTVQMSQTSSNSVMLKVGGAELLIDFMDNLSGAPAETAMVINGVEVATSIAKDPSSLQGLIASLVTSQLQNVDILGMPAADLVQAGLGLINGDTNTSDFSNLFGTLVRGVFNNFLSGSPLSDIFGQIAGPILGGSGGNNSSASNGQGNSNNNNNNNNNSSGGSLIGSIVNSIGGGLTGGNPLLGGIFSLITNLFK